MDPNATLRTFRESLELAENAPTETEKTRYLVDAVRAMEALDGWMTGGGFPPEDWGRKRWK